MSETTIAGYCRACGKALAESEIHRSHGALYCKEHAPSEGGPSQSPYTSPTPAFSNGPAMSSTAVSPGVAFVLGLIPGVGAIYNGQYAKGMVHVAAVGLAISILNNDAAAGYEPLVGLMLAAFWVYMPFEAYHTARNRQLGHPVDELSSLVPMKGSRFPAIPVILIGLGIVLLVNNLGYFELRRALRYWPVLLIGAGVYMLYVRLSVPGDSAPSGTGLKDPEK